MIKLCYCPNLLKKAKQPIAFVQYPVMPSHGRQWEEWVVVVVVVTYQLLLKSVNWQVKSPDL